MKAYEPNVSMGNSFLGMSPRIDLRIGTDTWRSSSCSSTHNGAVGGGTPFSGESRLINGGGWLFQAEM